MSCEIDGAQARDRRGFYRQLAQQLGFPAYFGNNLDALEDSLGDVLYAASATIEVTVLNPAELLAEEKPEYRARVAGLLADWSEPPDQTRAETPQLGSLSGVEATDVPGPQRLRWNDAPQWLQAAL